MATQPRVCLIADHDDSYGPEAGELALMAGLALDDWQQENLDAIFCTKRGKWAAREVAIWVPRQNGKSASVEAAIIAALILMPEVELILWSAHLVKTTLESFRRMKRYALKLDELGLIPRPKGSKIGVRILEGKGDQSIEILKTGQRIQFVARSSGSGRGMSPQIVVIDEALFYTTDEHSALKFALSAQEQPLFIFMSTPPLTGDQGEIMYGLRDRAERGAKNLTYIDYGLGGSLSESDLAKLDLSSLELAEQANPAYPHRVRVETVLDEIETVASVSPVEYARERLGIWPRQITGGGAIDMSRWGQMADAKSQRSGDVFIGVDIAQDRSYAAICLASVRADGNGHLVLVDYRPGTDWLVPRLVEIRDTLKPLAFAMGATTLAAIKTALELADFDIVRPSDELRPGYIIAAAARELSAATGVFLDSVRDMDMRHIDQRELNAAIAGVVIRLSGDGLVWSRKDALAEPSPVYAASLARWAYVNFFPVLDAANYAVLDSFY